MKTREVLALFYKSIESDPRISATHISLYMAFFHKWELSEKEEPVIFSSCEIMRIAKIDSRATYHKCLKDLVQGNYIRYMPSCNPSVKNQVYLWQVNY